MQHSEKSSIEELMQNPAIQRAIDSVNDETTERRAYEPLICDAFSGPYTRLLEDDS